MTTYQVTLGDRVFRVDLRQTDSGALVRVDDGAAHAVALTPVHGALYALSVGDSRTELLGTVAANTVALTIGGLEYQAEVVDEAHARLASVAGTRGSSHAHLELKAPMPGLVVRVLCQPGDMVQAGQPLVVLQAMKMENELALPRSGTVKAVPAQPGQTVEQGQVLVVVE
jgi:biotin carboxyl carrier protein